MKAVGEVIEVNREELQAVLEQKREALGEEDYQKLQKLLRAFSYLSDLIGQKDTTISELRALLQKPTTEKTEKVLERAGLEPGSKSSPPPPKGEAKPGHGRNGAEAYCGALRIPVLHASRKPGDRCPECLKGRPMLSTTSPNCRNTQKRSQRTRRRGCPGITGGQSNGLRLRLHHG